MQWTFRKLLAVGLALILLVTCMATGLTAIALGTTNLLANLTLSDTTGVTMDTANNGFTISGDTGATYFNNLVLEKNSTYELTFTLTLHGSIKQCPTFILRDNGSGTGQFFNWTGLWDDQGRFNTSVNPDGFEALVPTGMTATETAYQFKLELEPERVRLWVNGEVKVNTVGNTDAEGWASLPAVENGKIGFCSVNGANVTLSDLSLIEMVQWSEMSVADVEAAIEAIGDIDAYSRATIEAARTAWSALPSWYKVLVSNTDTLTAAEAAFTEINRLSAFGDTLTVAPSETKLFDGIILEKDATYVYEFDLTAHDSEPWNAVHPWLVLRGTQSDGILTTGQYCCMGAYTQFRFCAGTNYDDFVERTTNVHSDTLTGTHSFKIVMSPTRIEMYLDGTLVMWDPTTWKAEAVENGLFGIIGGLGTSCTLSDFSLVKVGDMRCKTHTWTEATCATPKTCSVCGVTEGEATRQHIYADGVCQGCDATEAGEMAQYFGYASNADNTALRFGFTVQVTGVERDESTHEADYTNARVTLGNNTYSVVEMGGIISNDPNSALTFASVNNRTLKIPAVKVISTDGGEVSFAIGIRGIPATRLNHDISCRPYLTYLDNEKKQVTIYSDIITHCVQDYIDATTGKA